MFTKEDIELYFNEINKRFSERGQHGEIVLAGGASMVVIFNARNATCDIDAHFRPSEAFRKIIDEIAQKYDLRDDTYVAGIWERRAEWMLTIERLISVLGLCLTGFGLGYAIGSKDNNKPQK